MTAATSTTPATATERLLVRDRVITVVGLAALAGLAWLYLLTGAGTGMSVVSMSTFAFPPPPLDGTATAWSPGYAALMVSMWWVMMIAMMLPSATPMVLLYARVVRHAQAKGQMTPGALPIAVFVLGYLAVWLGFSTLATLAQWALSQGGLVHQMMMWSTNETLTAGLLIVAGLWQLSPVKAACLAHCRAPAVYLSRHWRPGRGGAFTMGLDHGVYCLGCCWALMALLFAGGVMNLVWIATLASIVLIEKLSPRGAGIGRVLAVALIATGGWLLLRGGAG